MRRGLLRAAALASAIIVPAAFAEEGALTVELGGGGTALPLPAPFALTDDGSRPSQFGTTALARGGVRYGLTHWLEVGVTGFWEPPVRFTHHQVVVGYGGDPSAPDRWPGALQHQVTRFGGTAGARVSFGLRLRVTGDLQLGWSRRMYSGLHAYNTAHSPAVEWPVALSDFSVDNLLASAAVGFEYSLTDSLSLGVAPRFDVLLGSDSTVAVSLPLYLSWSWSL